jgi:hypothetical protein
MKIALIGVVLLMGCTVAAPVKIAEGVKTCAMVPLGQSEQGFFVVKMKCKEDE